MDDPNRQGEGKSFPHVDGLGSERGIHCELAQTKATTHIVIWCSAHRSANEFLGSKHAVVRMKKQSQTIPVKDGWVKREAATGRFIAVSTHKRVAKVSPKTLTTVREASSKRSSALKRLADR